MIDFVSLHNHSHFSMLDALASPKELFVRAKELGHKALAITDHGTLASAWESLKASKEAGVKLIIGLECYFLDDLSNKDERFRHLILLAKNAKGYQNLLTLHKKSYDNRVVYAKKVYPLIDWKILEDHAEGLICLTSCGNGILSQLLMLKKHDEAVKQLQKLKEIFGDDLGLEVQPNTLKRGSNLYNDVIEQVFVNRQIINLGKKYNVKVVPTCNAHYSVKEDAATHDVMLSIGAHQAVYSNFRLRYDCPEFYLKTGDEVVAFFERNYGREYAEELCRNSLYFADKCEEPNWIDPKFSNPSGKELPQFPVEDEPDYHQFREWLTLQSDAIKQLDEEDKKYLRFKCEQYFTGRRAPTQNVVSYRQRLEEELDVIYYCGVSSYLLIVADYIRWCQQNNISVGPGRGSAGGSYVAYLLGIHEADPIKYDLVFERFFNKKRTSFADIDCDFSQKDRYKVVEYITQKYGQEHVVAISNIIGITPKVYVKDVSRAHELGGSREAAVQIGNTVADTISAEYKTIETALNKAPLFGEYTKKYPELIKYQKICGKPRAMGQHAAGIIISKRPLHTIVPLRIDKDNITLIEYDKDVSEANGLVKMDILGLTTLDTIEETNRLIQASGQTAPKIDYDQYDQTTYDLISSGHTFGVFQFGTSAGTIDLCKKIKPKTIEDLAIITALARPVAQDIRESFIKVREGKQEMSLLHPLLKRAFEKTYGFALYDESLLILAKDIAGWDLDEADKLRKLTKEKGKNPQKVLKWRQEFIEGAVKNGVHEQIATMIWDTIISNFGDYAFNKSHAVLYSMISYHTAYLKAHFPVQFLLANLMQEVNSNAPSAKTNIEIIKKELRSQRIKIVPPNLNNSSRTYTIVDNKLFTGLDALKTVGEDAIQDIIEKRPFKSFFDFMHRVDSKKVRANAIQALIACGCFDVFKLSRKQMFLYCSDYRKKLQVWLKNHDPNEEEFTYPWPEADQKEWSLPELYALEYQFMNDAFICNIKEAYGNFFKGYDYVSLSDAKKALNKTNIKSLRAIVKDYFEFTVKKEKSKFYGQSMAKLLIEDANGEQCTLTVFPDRWKMIHDRMKELHLGKYKFDTGIAMHFSGSVNVFEDAVGIILNELYNFAPSPQKPIDLKSKQVKLKAAKKEKLSKQSLFQEIEDDLIQEGVLTDIEEDEEIVES